MKQDLLAKVERAQRLLEEVAEALREEEKPEAETRGGDDRKPPPGDPGP